MKPREIARELSRKAEQVADVSTFSKTRSAWTTTRDLDDRAGTRPELVGILTTPALEIVFDVAVLRALEPEASAPRVTWRPSVPIRDVRLACC